MNKYILELDKEQLEIISTALEFYSRIQIGQVSELANPFLLPLPYADYSNVENKIVELKKSMFPNLESNTYYSVKSKHVSDKTRQAIDMISDINFYLNSEKEENEIDLNKPIKWTDKNLIIKNKLSDR